MTIPRVLREKLGDDGVDALLSVFSEISLNTRTDLATKVDIKVVEEEIKRLEEEIKRLELKIESSKIESIKWMLAFWASQIGILIAAMAVMLKLFVK